MPLISCPAMEVTPGPAASPQPEETPSPEPSDTTPATTAAEEPSVDIEAPAAEPVAAAPEPEPVEAKAPEPAPAAPSPEPAPAKTEAPKPSAISSTVNVPADPDASNGEGGEFQLLLAKLNEQLGGIDLGKIWEQSKQPLKLVGLALVVIFSLQLLGAVLGTLDHIPMLPRLLQLVGLIWLSLFASQRLLRSDERKKMIDAVTSTWKDITGKG